MGLMYLALGYRCNHHCFFCPCGHQTDRTPQADYEELLRAIDEGIQKHSVQHITLSGGEPTLHPAFHSVVSYCVSKGLRVGVLSNGENFQSAENTKQLFDGINPSFLSVTSALHSDLSAPHDRVTGVRGSFQHTVDGLKNVLRLGIPVTIKQVVSRWNYQRLPLFVDFLFREYGPLASLTICGMDFSGMRENQIRQAAVSFEETGPYLEQALDAVAQLRQQFNAFPNVSVTDLPLCCVDPSYWGYFTKVSRGSLSQYSAPDRNMRGQVESFLAVQNDCDVYSTACRDCCVAEFCPGIWHSAYQFFGDQSVRQVQPG